MVLCDEVEVYVNQDAVSQRELIIGLPYTRPLEIGPYVDLSQKQQEVVTLLIRGLNRSKVCQILDIKRDTLRKRIERIKKKCHVLDP